MGKSIRYCSGKVMWRRRSWKRGVGVNQWKNYSLADLNPRSHLQGA
jgi:hypothetical protein